MDRRGEWLTARMCLMAGKQRVNLHCLANTPKSLQSYPLDENYRKGFPDPSEGSQAECQDTTANQGPMMVSTMPYRTATKYQRVAASECEQYAQLATGTAVS